VALKELTGSGTTGGVMDSARLAIESRHFQQAIETLWPHRDELDHRGLVMLALALESVGRQQDAIDMLVTATTAGTDPIGVLAGRLKRRWLVERRRADARQAPKLYAQSFERAEANRDPAHAHYHAINCAFMKLAYGGDIGACRAYADRACITARRRRTPCGGGRPKARPTSTCATRCRRLTLTVAQSRRPPNRGRRRPSVSRAYRAADLMGQQTLGAELRVMFGQSSAAI
jgi:hypothetical protein